MKTIHFILLGPIAYSRFCNKGYSSLEDDQTEKELLCVWESNIYPGAREIVAIGKYLYEVVATIHHIKTNEVKIYIRKAR